VAECDSMLEVGLVWRGEGFIGEWAKGGAGRREEGRRTCWRGRRIGDPIPAKGLGLVSDLKVCE